jgi:DNA invertase Pin-like site-specific DNA recombinase
MKTQEQRRAEADRLIERLIKLSPDAVTAARAQRLKSRLMLPMPVVIDRIPGKSIIEKAKLLKVSRQTVYYWLNGTTRPNQKQARIMAGLTGFDVDEIRGVAGD